MMINQDQPTQDVGTIELLSTKLAPPRLRSPVVSRAALLARLDEGLERKLTLLAAPAGSGKTTLVSEWSATRDEQFPVAWLSLDEGDNDPVRFWRYLIAACQKFDTEVGASALTLLRSAQQPPFDTIQTTFINDLSQLESKCVLVLEDYHVITSPIVHETMTFLLDRLPDTLHVLITARGDPPLPLARLRARDELLELHAADLRFSPAEIQSFLQQTTHLTLPADALARLEARTEGWAVGLRIVALVLQGRQGQEEAERFITTFTGGHRHILEYLVAEVLTAQSAPVQEFLLQTSFLNSMTGSLCDAVTGNGDSDILLEQLERANLFLIPLDDTQGWYRYHALFAEAMQQYARRQLGDDRVRELRLRASRWYEAHKMLTEAVEMELVAQEYAHAADLIERILDPRLMKMNNEYFTLRRWISQLPEAVLSDHPTLCLTYAIAILFTSDRHSPETLKRLKAPLQMAEQRWMEAGNTNKLGEVLAFRTLVEYWQGDYVQSFSTARQALELLPEYQTEWRGVMLLQIAAGEWFAGNTRAARQLAQDARVLNEAAGNEYAKRSTTQLLGEVSLYQGRLYEAEQLFQELFEKSSTDLRDKAHALVGLAKVAYERNDLDVAERYVTEAYDIGEKVGDKYILVDAAILLARALRARGETTQASQVLHSLAASVGVPSLVGLLRAWHAWIALSTGDTPVVQGWYTTYVKESEHDPTLQQEREALIAARWLIAQREIEAALRLLDHWQRSAHAGERVQSELEILIVKALAYFVGRRLPQAEETIISALESAHKAGYMRPFLDEGKTMIALLQEVSPVKDKVLSAYVEALLRAFAFEQTGREVAARRGAMAVHDWLSPQEQRVLRLLAAGLSNPEIADELVVSVNTIKTQVKSIYRKLNVTNREDAREKARQLKLV